MLDDARRLLRNAGGLATTAQLLTVMTRQQLDVQVRKGGLVRVWYGVYAETEPDLPGRLRALDLFMGQRAVACMGTAAALYDFDTENTTAIHVLDPGVRMRPTLGLMVHQRRGAQLSVVAGRLATAPAWTAVEVARELRRPRVLATLDGALRSGWCSASRRPPAIWPITAPSTNSSRRPPMSSASSAAQPGMTATSDTTPARIRIRTIRIPPSSPNLTLVHNLRVER